MRLPFRIIGICICYYSPVCFPASLGGALFTPEAKEERTPSKPLNPNTKAEAGPFSEEGQFLFSPPLLTANSKKQIFNQNRQPPPPPTPPLLAGEKASDSIPFSSYYFFGFRTSVPKQSFFDPRRGSFSRKYKKSQTLKSATILNIIPAFFSARYN